AKNSLPEAIRLKFKHRDTAFFKTFARGNEVRPQHQQEYWQLYHAAMEQYKKVHNVIMITNKANKDQLHSMLKKKLMTDCVKSLDMNRKDPHELTRDLFYGIGFAAIRTHIRFEEVRALIRQIKSEQLIPLPDSPDLIEKKVREMIPFELPIERIQTGPSVRVLRK